MEQNFSTAHVLPLWSALVDICLIHAKVFRELKNHYLTLFHYSELKWTLYIDPGGLEPCRASIGNLSFLEINLPKIQISAVTTPDGPA